ncbi:MAG: ASKHA domain-containing protein, partial [Phycisphaerae bacterium]|nr:ASKHA domain-containing protein [Phycisphaerae bacterium]
GGAGPSIRNSEFRIPNSRGRLRVIRLEAGDTTTRHFGLAIDIGTTTVAVQLVNLTTGKIMATRSDYNDQIACGLDVLSRINYARRPDRLGELQARVLGTINRLMRQVAESHHVDPHEICNAVLSGNTTMTHLLLGLSPEYIRLDPYTPTVMSLPFLTAAEVGLDITPDSWLYLSPAVGSYVGGDITAGLLCTGLASEPESVSLFIDIGTNGEIVLGNAEFLMTCACSAGPAFEGGGIDCGMRAALGAIEKVDIDPATGVASYSTIGRVRPKGICGSGMIDLLAKLLRTGWIDAAGKFDRSRPSASVRIDGRKARYVIATAAESGTGQPITIGEIDIENIVRAKAAIYSACALMLRHVGVAFADLANVYIAGGFGRFLDLENATTIGLLPDIARERFHYLGNTSLMGSYMIAVSQDYRQRQLDLASRMTCLDLSTEPNYMEQYTGALFLPHTDRAQFATVWERLDKARRGDGATGRRGDERRGGEGANGRRGEEERREQTSSFSRRTEGPRVERSEQQNPTNKQKAIEDAIALAVEQLRSIDLAARCAPLGLPLPARDGSVTIRLFGADVRIAPATFEATNVATGRPAKPVDRLLALHYLLCDRLMAPAGQLISFRDLPGGQFYWASFQERTTVPLVRRFGNDVEALRANLARFQWCPCGLGDVGAAVQAVGVAGVTLVYRRGDEEFPPTAEVFFDASIRHAFNTEDVAALASRVCIGLL